jgi:hypothetical protein
VEDASPLGRASTQSALPQGARSPTRRCHATWLLILYALWFTWAFALAVAVKRLDPRDRRRLALPLLLGAALWLSGELLLVTRPLRWEWLTGLRLAWSVLGGLVCALVARGVTEAGERTHALREMLRLSPGAWKRALGCGALFYFVALADVTMVSTILRVLDPSSRQVLSAQVLLWASPGVLFGVAIALVWELGADGVSARMISNFFVGVHVVALGIALVLAFDFWATSLVEPPSPLSVLAAPVTVSRWLLAFLLVPAVVYSVYISLATSGRRVLARALACVGLFAASCLQLELSVDAIGLWQRHWALGHERAPDVTTQRRAIGAWEGYLAAFPETDERAEALWRIATSHARLGEHAAAHDTYETLAHLPADAQGQRWARWSRLLLAHPMQAGTRSMHRRRRSSNLPSTSRLHGGARSAFSPRHLRPPRSTSSSDVCGRSHSQVTG